MTSKDIYASLTEYVDQSNKYYRTYVNLCSRAATRGSRKNAKSTLGYVEGHHIIPRSYNKELQSERNNMVYMSAREHFIAHKILIRISSGVYVHKAKLAILKFMQKNKLQHRILSSRDFEYVRKIASEASTGEKNPRYGKPGTVLSKTCYTNGIRNIFINKDEEIPEGFHMGSKLKSFITYTNGVQNICLSASEVPPAGFYKGSSTKGKQSKLKGRKCEPFSDERKSNISKGNSGKIWITDGVTDKRININEVIPDDWYQGRVGCPYPQKYINDFLEYNEFKSLNEFKVVLTKCVSEMTFSQLCEKFPKAKHFSHNHPSIGRFLIIFDLNDRVKRGKGGRKRKKSSIS